MEFVKQEVHFLVRLTLNDVKYLLHSLDKYKYSDPYSDEKTLDKLSSMIETLEVLEQYGNSNQTASSLP